MTTNAYKELSISIILIVLAVVLLNPFHMWMPDMMLTAILILTLVAFALFAVFIVREKATDERELTHRMLAGRVAFLTGASILTLGIVVEATSHAVDPWLVITLVGMVISKIITRVYCDSKL